MDSANRGVAEFYYTEKVPQHAVTLAFVRSKPGTPADLTDINNLYPETDALKPGRLTVTGWPVARTHDAVILHNSVDISGNQLYYLENQFFEITNRTGADGKPLYYVHLLPLGVNDVTVFGANGEEVSAYVVQNGAIYHSLDGTVYWVRYYDGKTLRTELLRYAPAMRQTTGNPAADTYSFDHGVLKVASDGHYFIRFTEDNGYKLLPPYDVLSTEPWYLRVRTGLRPVAPEWGRQLFLPFRPYMLATWVPGRVVDGNVVEFARRPILFDGKQYPDVLVFDKDYNFKYALDGTPVGVTSKKGFLYPWKRAQVLEMDLAAGRLHLAVPLEKDDQCFGFYFYKEPDVIYRDLDINPFTNPDVKNRVIQIVYKPNATNPFQNLYHRVLDEYGDPIAELSNEPEGEGAVVLGTLLVGGSVGLNEFRTEDTRVRGGGLAKEHQDIPESKDFWDLGFWDGQPYPVGGATVVYLPRTLLKPVGKFSQTEVQQIVRAAVPMGVLPVVRYYDQDGEEDLGVKNLMLLFDNMPGNFDDARGVFDEPEVEQ